MIPPCNLFYKNQTHIHPDLTNFNQANANSITNIFQAQNNKSYGCRETIYKHVVTMETNLSHTYNSQSSFKYSLKKWSMLMLILRGLKGVLFHYFPPMCTLCNTNIYLYINFKIWGFDSKRCYPSFYKFCAKMKILMEVE